MFRPALGIAADLNAFAAAAAALPRRARLARLDGEAAGTREAGREPPDYPHALNVAAAMRELETLLAPDAICTCDAGNFAGWPQRFMNFGPGQRFLGPTNGAMGYSVPAAVGAKIAFPDRMVVAFVGDGGFMMTGQEIATAFHHGVAPIVLVFNNQMYGTIRMYQERSYPGRVSGTALTNPDFARLIEAFGGHGETVTETAQFAAAFQPRGGERQAGGDRAGDGSGADHQPRHGRAVAGGHRGGEAGRQARGEAGAPRDGPAQGKALGRFPAEQPWRE